MKLAFVLLSAAAFAQTQFEVASIRPSGPPGGDHMSLGIHIDGARFSCTYSFNLKPTKHQRGVQGEEIYARVQGPRFYPGSGALRHQREAAQPARLRTRSRTC